MVVLHGNGARGPDGRAAHVRSMRGAADDAADARAMHAHMNTADSDMCGTCAAHVRCTSDECAAPERLRCP